MVLALDIDDDRTEYCISFDPLLKFWYDPDRVKSVWISEANEYYEEDNWVMVSHFNNMIEVNKSPPKEDDEQTQREKRLNTAPRILPYWDRLFPYIGIRRPYTGIYRIVFRRFSSSENLSNGRSILFHQTRGYYPVGARSQNNVVTTSFCLTF